MQLIFELVDWLSRLPFQTWVDLIWSAEGLSKISRPSLPLVRENSSCLMAFWLASWFFPTSGLKLKHQLFLSLEPLGLQVRIKPMASLGLWLWLSLNASGLVSLHDDMNWFPRANVSLSLFLIYTPYWFCFSGGH